MSVSSEAPVSGSMAWNSTVPRALAPAAAAALDIASSIDAPGSTGSPLTT